MIGNNVVGKIKHQTSLQTATGRSKDQPGGEGATSHVNVPINTTRFDTDIHSLMNKRGIAKIISVVYGASFHKSTAAMISCRAESGGMVQNEDVSRRLSEIQGSAMVTLVQGPGRGGAQKGIFTGADWRPMCSSVARSRVSEKGMGRKSRTVSSSGGRRS